MGDSYGMNIASFRARPRKVLSMPYRRSADGLPFSSTARLSTSPELPASRMTAGAVVSPPSSPHAAVASSAAIAPRISNRCLVTLPAPLPRPAEPTKKTALSSGRPLGCEKMPLPFAGITQIRF